MNWVAPIKDQETLKNFGETLKQVDYKYYIMFELGVGTGLQLQDILAFKNKDVTGKKENRSYYWNKEYEECIYSSWRITADY